ncbi:MAG: hypothetical protein PVH91_15500 [Pseudomonadales bacterium]|jgi:hypothetical protein
MHEDDERLMVQYGIAAETKVLFHYDGYRYERLADAVSYAKAQQARLETHDTSHDSGERID